MSVVIRFLSVLLCLSVVANVVVLAATDKVLSLHGSGTNNPAECYSHIMGRLQSQTKIPTRLTYRQIGSTSGMEEFTNARFLVDFASGDLPLPEDVYNNFRQNGEDVVQLPVVLGAIAFFHNIPNTPNLNLTSCLLAKIYKGDITEWQDPAILAENPSLVLPPGGLEVQAKHRSDGSSSTAGITGWLAKACPSEWSQDDQGSRIQWKGNSEGCQGSSAMKSKIEASEGTIGYMTAGHGHDSLLQEPILKNNDGTRILSYEAYLLGGVERAANADSLPNSPSDYFPVDKFVDEPGEFVWPIVLMTYIYVRKDLRYIENPEKQALLKAFLQSLYMDEYITQCETEFEFSRVGGPALELALQGIDSLILSPNTTEFIFETSTQQVIGAGDYVISTKRESIGDIERDFLGTDLEVLQDEVRYLKDALDRSELEHEANNFKVLKLEETLFGSGGVMRTIVATSFSTMMLMMTVSTTVVLVMSL